MREAPPHARALRVAAVALVFGVLAAGDADARRSSSAMPKGGLQCVPFARAESGIQISGNARTWWAQAAGLYARSNEPEVGSVLHFPGVRRMPLGHVAVVSGIVSDRELLVDHANWAGPGGRKGQVVRNMRMVDVSPRGDWTQVRVFYDRQDRFGDVYATSGFIHPRPPGSDPNGAMYASARSSKAVAAARRDQAATRAPELATVALDEPTRLTARIGADLPLPPQPPEAIGAQLAEAPRSTYQMSAVPVSAGPGFGDLATAFLAAPDRSLR